MNGIAKICGAALLSLGAAVQPAGAEAPQPGADRRIVRLARIEVHPQHLQEYRRLAAEVGRASFREEEGVLTLFSVAEKNHPERIVILEIYRDEAAYRRHVASAHFQRYKQGTLHMVKSLELVDCDPLVPEMLIKPFRL